MKFVDEYSGDNAQLRAVLGITKPDPRMRDAELVIRYFAFRNFLQTYTGNLKPLLDETAKQFNIVWETDRRRIDIQTADFEKAMACTISVFSEANAFRKWNGQRYEYALNRAIFDVMIYFFVDPAVRQSVTLQTNLVENTFKDLCLDENFRVSVEGTTKSIDSIYTRLNMWAVALNSIDVPARSPVLKANKILRQ